MDNEAKLRKLEAEFEDHFSNHVASIFATSGAIADHQRSMIKSALRGTWMKAYHSGLYSKQLELEDWLEGKGPLDCYNASQLLKITRYLQEAAE